MHLLANIPSGHIYSREAIISYLLTKTQELKEQKQKYETQLKIDKAKQIEKERVEEHEKQAAFLTADQKSAVQLSQQSHNISFKQSLKRKIDIETKEEGKKKLKCTSYWLSESQPEEYTEEMKEDEIRKNIPRDRPSSPMTGNYPLRMKDLVPITLQRESKNGREGGDSAANDVASIGSKCLCAVSNKVISTQQAVAIKKTGAVILEDIFLKIVKPQMVCPVTGKKFKEKDILYLKKCASGFAASGQVVATKYKPTIT